MARREVVAIVLFLLAAALALGLRPALRALAPQVAVDRAFWRAEAPSGLDPWGAAWTLPGYAWSGPDATPAERRALPVASAGPDGADDTRVYAAAERLRMTIELAWEQDRRAAWRRGGRSGTAWREPAARWGALREASSRALLLAAVRAGPGRDDLFVGPDPGPGLLDVLDSRRLQLLLAAIAWLLGARPLAPRSSRLAVEAWRALALASAPAFLLGALAREGVGAWAPWPGPELGPRLVPGDVAVGLSAGLVALLAAVWLRARAPAPGEVDPDERRGQHLAA